MSGGAYDRRHSLARGDKLTIVSTRPIRGTAELARYIRAARRARGWTQTDLAQRANVSRGVVQKIEEARGTTANLATVLSLLRAMSLDLSIASRKGNTIAPEDELEGDD